MFATLSETSTGVGHDLEAFGKIVAKTDALFIVDGISGLGAMECRIDAWDIDVCVTGSQKALMLPPGLAFVSVSEKAWKKIDATPVRSFYLDLRRYKKSLAESDTPFTPANTLIKAQRASLKRIRAEGIENLWARHARIAAACRARREGDGAGGVRRAAQQRADGHHGAGGRGRHRDAQEAGEAVRLQARRRPGHAEGEDLAASATWATPTRSTCSARWPRWSWCCSEAASSSKPVPASPRSRRRTRADDRDWSGFQGSAILFSHGDS